MISPGEQQIGESAKAYAAFIVYRDMGPERSIVKVGKKLGKSVALLERWSSKFGWSERVRAFDKHQYALLLKTEEENLIKLQKQKGRISLAFQAPLYKRLERFNEADWNALRPVETYRLLKDLIAYREESILLSNPDLFHKEGSKENWQPIRYIEVREQKRKPDDILQLSESNP